MLTRQLSNGQNLTAAFITQPSLTHTRNSVRPYKVKSCKVLPPRIGVSTAAPKPIFSRKLLMNFGFPPLTPRELRLTSVETNLGITPYSLRKKKPQFLFQHVCANSSPFYHCFSLTVQPPPPQPCLQALLTNDEELQPL